MKTYIEITVSPDGTITEKAHGFKGVGCRKVMQQAALDSGATVSEEGDTPEYYAGGGGENVRIEN